MSGFKINGLEDIQRKLKKNCDLGDVKKVVRHHGSQLQTKAQECAPVDTGNLKKGIGISIEDGGMEARIAPSAEYAPYVEYGTRFMENQPYLRPAFNEQKGQFKSDLKKLMG